MVFRSDEITMTEHEKARLWRQAMGLSRKRLSDLTGYSVSSISDIEAGMYRFTGRPVPPHVMKRYRTACGAVTADVSFDWYRAKIKRKQEGGDHSQALETVKDLTLTERPKS
jgi:transcriptional regulator with XRE-family HTH domain